MSRQSPFPTNETLRNRVLLPAGTTTWTAQLQRTERSVETASREPLQVNCFRSYAGVIRANAVDETVRSSPEPYSIPTRLFVPSPIFCIAAHSTTGQKSIAHRELVAMGDAEVFDAGRTGPPARTGVTR